VLRDRRSRCSLEVAIHVEPLEEPGGVAEALELVAIDEQVVLAVYFVLTAGPRRRRDGEPQARVALEEPPDDRSLADAGGPGEDEQDSQGRLPISRIA
jgi:hypothetical protein